MIIYFGILAKILLIIIKPFKISQIMDLVAKDLAFIKQNDELNLF